MTRDEALTMIIASIAMEELALGHIVNAEGEKLQYILGTLPGGPKPCAGTQEVLAVNKSVKELLDTVTQSQMLLKGKLEKALEAGGPAPGPECPCGPDHPCRPSCPERPPCPDKPPCGESSGPKSAIQLVSRCNGFSWDNDYFMTWKCQGRRGRGIHWDEKTPSAVGLDPEKAYTLDYAINVRGPCLGGSTGAIFTKLTPGGAFTGVLPLYFSVKCLDCKPLTLHYSTTLFPRACPAPHVSLSLLLNYSGGLFVDQASLSIVEI